MSAPVRRSERIAAQAAATAPRLVVTETPQTRYNLRSRSPAKYNLRPRRLSPSKYAGLMDDADDSTDEDWTPDQ